MHKFKAIRGKSLMQMFIDMISYLRRNDIHCDHIDGKVQEKETERENVKMKEKKFVLN